MTDEIVNPVAWVLGLPVRDEGFVGAFGLVDGLRSRRRRFTVIPAPTEPGTYRICGGLKDALCSAAFKVTS